MAKTPKEPVKQLSSSRKSQNFPSPVVEPNGTELAPRRMESNLLKAELEFYRNYPWSLNPLLSIEECIEHLLQELSRLDRAPNDWRRDEVITNIFLLGGWLAAAVEDYLCGPTHDFTKIAKRLSVLGTPVRAVAKVQALYSRARAWRLHRLKDWGAEWRDALSQFLTALPGIPSLDAKADTPSATRLSSLLSFPLPKRLRRLRPRIPGAFRSKDLTHHDVVSLGKKLVSEFPDRGQPLLIIGLRTAGSFFAVVLRAFLKARGYEKVRSVTLRPKRGPGFWELQELARGSKEGALALVIDEHPNTGITLVKTVDILRRVGLASAKTVFLFPVHPAHPDWRDVLASQSLSHIRVIHLEPEEWHKYRVLSSDAVAARLTEYFRAHRLAGARLAHIAAVEQANVALPNFSDEKVHARMKRVYEVRSENEAGKTEIRFILAKGVGSGWLGYHAFLAGIRLESFVPTILGLRDGILYMEWLPQKENPSITTGPDRDRLVSTVASYVATRVRRLGLDKDPVLEFAREDNHEGYALLAGVLSRAYRGGAALQYPRIRSRVSGTPCPSPTLIDGRMNLREWIRFSSTFLKADFEHHGLGKVELNITDPAYDLADAVLHLQLSPEEESRLLQQYRIESGDGGAAAAERLFFHKLIAGARELSVALEKLNDQELVCRHEEFSRRYVDAWNFLTVHTTRFCGSFCHAPAIHERQNPIVFLDIDGVLDDKIFGFPCTTAAGIRAISLLHAHGLALAVNTARSLREVKEYCGAYKFCGGVAEYGSVLWDALTCREQSLVDPESHAQLDILRRAMREIPGVFFDHTYFHSIRAFSYDRKGRVPLPKLLIQGLLARLRLDRLSFHQTNIDTAVFAKGTGKGAGLRTFLEWAEKADRETMAIGDSETDLAMFREVTRSYAPSQICCKPAARRLGCRISDRPHQIGFLTIARTIVHPDGDRCPRCQAGELPWKKGKNTFLDMLVVADQKPIRRWLNLLLDPMIWQAFRKY